MAPTAAAPQGAPASPPRSAFVQAAPAWVDEQKRVICAAPSARLVVEAAPGTGKTAVACARAVRLIMEEDLAASSILMVSFTRTAVAEMRKRMQLMCPDGRAAPVTIATLDQVAFSLGIGTGAEFSKLMGSFEGNISQAVELLNSRNPVLMEYLARLKHVIIDEAQDLTGQRARFTALLLDSLGKETGATVFADRAQSIFGFTSDLDDRGQAEGGFMDSYGFKAAGFPKPLELTVNHRCGSSGLAGVFGSARKALGGKGSRTERVKKVTDVVEASAKCDGSDVKKLPLSDGDLLLYRRRASALMSLQHCPILYRIRMPGYPAAVFPWVAAVLADWHGPVVTEAEFAPRWTALPACLVSGYDLPSAWSLLRQFAGDRRGAVDVRELRRLVARPRPPVELCFLDHGGIGPVFSTIHASKGREADRVFLMLPHDLDYLESEWGRKIDADEEARVFYVGATRMRHELRRGRALTVMGASALKQNGQRVVQAISFKKWPKFQFGLEGDIEPALLLDRDAAFCTDAAAARAGQAALIEIWRKCHASGSRLEVSGALAAVTTRTGREQRYRFDCSGTPIAWSGAALPADLKFTSDRLKRDGFDLPAEIKGLQMNGLRSCAVPEGPVHEGRLHEPYSTSGFHLAPMITGFPSIFFPFAK